MLLGALIAGVGYLIKRRLEKKPQFDTLEKSQKLLAISKELAAQNLSVEGLRKLEDSLLTKKRSTKERGEELREEIADAAKDEVSDDRFGGATSNIEMKHQASTNVKIAEAKLEQVVFELSMKLDEEGGKALELSQRAWKRYRTRQAEFAASSWLGGTGYGLIYMSEVESLTIDRTAILQTHLDEVKELYG